jgi:hypothetical protein
MLALLKADPIHVYCLNVIKKELFLSEFVDDCLVIGKEGHNPKQITDLKAGAFNLKVTKQLTDYLSCCVSQETRF